VKLACPSEGEPSSLAAFGSEEYCNNVHLVAEKMVCGYQLMCCWSVGLRIVLSC